MRRLRAVARLRRWRTQSPTGICTCSQDQVKDMLAWLELRAAVLMKLERREDAAAVYRSAA